MGRFNEQMALAIESASPSSALVTVRQAAQLIGVKETWMYRLVYFGKVRARNYGCWKMIELDELRRYVAIPRRPPGRPKGWRKRAQVSDD